MQTATATQSRRRGAHNRKQALSVSAVLPAFNEEALIEETVRVAAAVLDADGQFDVLAGRSPTGARPHVILRAFVELIRLRFRVDREASQRLHFVRRAV